MIQTRRNFLGVLALSLLSRKKAFSKTTTDHFIEFQKIFELKLSSVTYIDSNSRKIILSDLNTKWKSFEMIENRCYWLDNRLFVPVILKAGETVVDYSMICYENVFGELKNVPSLTRFHIAGITKYCQNLPKSTLVKAILPKYSTEYVPYGYKTETGKLILKTTCSYEKNLIHLIIDSEMLSYVEHKFQTSNQR